MCRKVHWCAGAEREAAGQLLVLVVEASDLLGESRRN